LVVKAKMVNDESRDATTLLLEANVTGLRATRRLVEHVRNLDWVVISLGMRRIGAVRFVAR
jgi:hypothetical protein